MDKGLIEEKLESLRRCVKRMADKRPATEEGFEADQDLQDIISLNLTRAVQLCVDIAAHIISESESRPPGTMAEAFDTLQRAGIIDEDIALRMKKAVGFRNIAVHNYQEIDWKIVFSIIHQNLDDFKQFAKQISNIMQQS